MIYFGAVCAWISIATIGVMIALDDSFWGRDDVAQTG
jgi:hypothetical protein